MTEFHIKSGSWHELKQDAQLIRRDVFIREQGISEHDEWDDQDPVSIHFVLYDQKKAAATARLLENNSIGRVAVLKDYRGQGVGLVMMKTIIDYAKQQNRRNLKLSSQVQAIPFYERLGFTTDGVEYLDCGIPHIDMFLNL